MVASTDIHGVISLLAAQQNARHFDGYGFLRISANAPYGDALQDDVCVMNVFSGSNLPLVIISEGMLLPRPPHRPSS